MKNILKTILFTFLATTLFSCEDSVNRLASAKGFSIKAVTNNSPIPLLPTTGTNTVLVLEWDKSDNGVDSQEANYLIEVAAAGTNFAQPITGNLGSAINLVNGVRTYTMKVKEINDLANKLPNFSFCNQMSIDVRIKSKLGDYDASAFFQPSSNFVTVTVTPYSTAKYPIAIVLNGGNVTTSPKIKSTSFSNTNDFEGYVYLPAGNYKIYQPNACGDFTTPIVFGQGGTSGSLVANGTDIVVPTTGHYIIKVNLVSNTYTLTEYTAIGAFGRATRAGGIFSQTVPFTYDIASKEWTGTLDLLEGQPFKLKAIKWTGPLVTPDVTNAFPRPDHVNQTGSTSYTIFGKGAADNVLADAGSNIVVPGVISTTSTKKYKITANLSDGRNYSYKLELIP